MKKNRKFETIIEAKEKSWVKEIEKQQRGKEQLERTEIHAEKREMLSQL